MAKVGKIGTGPRVRGGARGGGGGGGAGRTATRAAGHRPV
jgi:hypothetical protein